MIEIVPESPERHAKMIEVLFDRTFGPGHFAKTAERFREFSASLPLLNRVAVEDGEVVAVTRIWPLEIETGGEALFVGPVAVDPRHRGNRLGLQVTSASLAAAKEGGWTFALLIGAPAYFGEIGFKPMRTGQFVLPGPQDYSRVMLCELNGKAEEFSGVIRANLSV
ncbi:MAG: N-acetyltransferase [Pseudomonadota bacterium]